MILSIGKVRESSMDIYSYLDYRTLLNDFYESSKRESEVFSYRYIGIKVGLDAAYVMRVFKKSRHISAKVIPKFIKLLKLDRNEARYFELLVQFGKAKTEEERKIYFEKLLDIRGIDITTVSMDQYEYYSKWYHTAIRSLFEFYRFTGSYKELGAKLEPSITEKQARESVELLLRLGLLEILEDGSYFPTTLFVTSGDSWTMNAIKRYQEDTMDLAKSALFQLSKDVRDISTVTITANHNNLNRMRELVQKFRQDVMKISDEGSTADTLYQLNIQLFPLVKED